jgi:hypothetical protein
MSVYAVAAKQQPHPPYHNNQANKLSQRQASHAQLTAHREN